MSEQGGTKFDSEKPRMDLLPTAELEDIARVLTFGAAKYGEWNWKSGFKFGRLSAAALRHLFAWMRGESKDPETGASHLAHSVCCLLFLMYMEKNKPELDDRYKA